MLVTDYGKHKYGFFRGFAPKDGEFEYPNLWNSCVLAASPSLGPTGVNLFDWSKNKLHGTLSGSTLAAMWSFNKSNYCIYFDGTSWVDFGANSKLNITQPLTICAWVYSGGAPSSDGGIISKGSYGSYGYHLIHAGTLGADDHKVYFVIVTSSGQTFLPSTTSINDNKWHHICGIYTGSKMFIYVDGKEENTSTARSGDIYLASTTNLSIGARGGGIATRFSGSINDIRIYDRIISQDELLTLASDIGISYHLKKHQRNTLNIISVSGNYIFNIANSINISFSKIVNQDNLFGFSNEKVFNINNISSFNQNNIFDYENLIASTESRIIDFENKYSITLYKSYIYEILLNILISNIKNIEYLKLTNSNNTFNNENLIGFINNYINILENKYNLSISSTKVFSNLININNNNIFNIDNTKLVSTDLYYLLSYLFSLSSNKILNIENNGTAIVTAENVFLLENLYNLSLNKTITINNLSSILLNSNIVIDNLLVLNKQCISDIENITSTSITKSLVFEILKQYTRNHVLSFSLLQGLIDNNIIPLAFGFSTGGTRDVVYIFDTRNRVYSFDNKTRIFTLLERDRI